MKQLLTQYAWILGIGGGLLLLVLLTGCNQPPLGATKPLVESVENEHTVEDTGSSYTPNFNGIAHALGCVFAPDSCNKQ